MKIRTWWLNRLFLYWIPGIFVYDLISVAAKFEMASALTNVSIAVLIVLFFEQYLFSYRIDLVDEELRYSQGLAWRKKISLKRANIVSACFLPTPILAKLNSSRLLLIVRDGGEHVVSLASFRPADISKIIEWLPIKVTDSS